MGHVKWLLSCRQSTRGEVEEESRGVGPGGVARWGVQDVVPKFATTQSQRCNNPQGHKSKWLRVVFLSRCLPSSPFRLPFFAFLFLFLCVYVCIWICMLTRVWNSAAIVVKITRSPHTHSHEHTHTFALSHAAKAKPRRKWNGKYCHEKSSEIKKK